MTEEAKNLSRFRFPLNHPPQRGGPYPSSGPSGHLQHKAHPSGAPGEGFVAAGGRGKTRQVVRSVGSCNLVLGEGQAVHAIEHGAFHGIVVGVVAGETGKRGESGSEAGDQAADQ